MVDTPREPRKTPTLPKTSTKTAKTKVNWPRMALFITAILLVSILGIGSGLAFSWAREAPSINMSDLDIHTTTQLFDDKDVLFANLHAGENRTLVEKIDTVPKNLRNAFLAIEDNKFYEHHGLDFTGLVRAVFANITDGFGSQGASTITQQLVKLSFLTPEKTLKRKVQELILSLQLERNFTKDEIFLMYLNRIYFGEGAYGVKAAAQTFYGKDLEKLDLSEAALLAGLPNAPSKWSPYRDAEVAEQRRQTVLNQMVKFGYITGDEAEKAKKNPPKLLEKAKRTSATGDNNFPYFVDAVIQECIDKYGITENQLYKGGLKIYTTVDPAAQKAAEAALSDPGNFPKGKDDTPIQAAIAVLDHSNGEARAIVGGREYTVKRGLNRATDLKRQPGSVFKPIAVYGPALEKGMTPATVLDDVPVQYGSYQPGNYDGTYRGLITMREAAQFSVNIYAVKMLNEIGVQTGFDFARKLGIKTLDEKQDLTLPLALGGLHQGTNPFDLASAYGAFANHGVWNEPHVIRKVVDRDGNTIVEVKPKQSSVMKETTAYLMTNILETVVQAGTGTRAQMDRPVAGKTGTTELPSSVPEFRGITGNKDAWFAGYTPELVGVVWMGYDNTDKNHYMYKTYGGSYPAQIWRAVMTKALAGTKAKSFVRPPGIVEANVDIKSGLLPSALTPAEYIRTELFAEGTVPGNTSNVWQEVEVNAETGQPHKPGDSAKTVKKVFLKRPTPYEGATPADADLETPHETTVEKPTQQVPATDDYDQESSPSLPNGSNKTTKPENTGKTSQTPSGSKPQTSTPLVIPPGTSNSPATDNGPKG
ncbi:PBP1A family penicillin-binding protein [Heliobacterium chlorum]|uniref:Penicillin-binding protein 1A n=1 Tax=Heliobacterium chlorum TaxID=2698 RepID=A0ABR7SZ35_HELCL|nr:PBP1A family penicillin-binding protein [Heliobacterium chlorum]